MKEAASTTVVSSPKPGAPEGGGASFGSRSARRATVIFEIAATASTARSMAGHACASLSTSLVVLPPRPSRLGHPSAATGPLRTTDAWLSWILPHIARDVGSVVLAVGNASDHVHVLARYPATLAISELARRLKGSSSHAWNGERPASTPRLCWQSGFWAESVSLPDLSRIERYLARQREHHRDGASPEAWQTALP